MCLRARTKRCHTFLASGGANNRSVRPYGFHRQSKTFEEPEMDKEQEKAAKARDAALNGALSQIERQFGKGSIMKMGDDDFSVGVAAIPTGALSLDLALGVG